MDCTCKLNVGSDICHVIFRSWFLSPLVRVYEVLCSWGTLWVGRNRNVVHVLHEKEAGEYFIWLPCSLMHTASWSQNKSQNKHIVKNLNHGQKVIEITLTSCINCLYIIIIIFDIWTLCILTCDDDIFFIEISFSLQLCWMETWSFLTK